MTKLLNLPTIVILNSSLINLKKIIKFNVKVLAE